MDYNKTIHLPKTGFPMRAGLPAREPERLKRWEELDLYSKIRGRNAGKPKFVLHDGPPYANGGVHMGTALNKTLKDFIVRYKNMTGFRADYVPGWDTHGLPIETAIKRGKRAVSSDPAEFRKQCRAYAEEYVDLQRGVFKRLGVIGDWDNPYLTCSPDFEAKQTEIFGAMAEKGYIYKGLKPVYWCPHDKTALAEAEIEYADVGVESIYVRFRTLDEKLRQYGENVYFVIWTTTTWTLPGNLGISLHPDIDYALAQAGDGVYIIAGTLLPEAAKNAGWDEYKILDVKKGAFFDRMNARHPLFERDSLIMTGNHVTAEDGTGCVHTAPGHGAEDFVIGKEYGLDVIVPVDENGYMTAEAGEFEGLFYEKANAAILERLKSNGALLSSKRLEHAYAHCWRCKHPVIFRATEQWFASVEAIKDDVIKEVERVKWYPEWGKERMSAMVRDRADWCVSRQRLWGVPIPVFYCGDCGKPYYNRDTFKAVSELFAREGSDAWYTHEAKDILPPGSQCPCGSHNFRKESDIMDVWFDSGSSYASVCTPNPAHPTWDLKYPADVYLEGGDQYRGWFQSSLLTSVAVYGHAPYDEVISHGWVVDGEGRKMSKSLGNGMDPIEVTEGYGADILRLWAAGGNYREDVRVSKDMLKQLSEIYLKIRNTARFMLGNLDGFDPKDALPFEKFLPLDKWAFAKLNALVKLTRENFEKYSFHPAFAAIHNFCAADMSNFYLDAQKDTLYCGTDEARLSARSALYMILNAFTRLIAPILPFTADEIWEYVPDDGRKNGESVFLNDFPEYRPEYDLSPEESAYWERTLVLRDKVNAELEKARAAKIIGKSLEASVTLTGFGGDTENLPLIFIVSEVTAEKDGEFAVKVAPAEGEKCPRCWNFHKSGGELCPRCRDALS